MPRLISGQVEAMPQTSLLRSTLFLLINLELISSSYLSSYFMQRQEIIAEEQSTYFGSKIMLDEVEELANSVIMKYKYEELQIAQKNPRGFPPSRNFLHVSRLIEKESLVFRAIRRMPKAGLLHAHLSAITSRDFILRNVTQRPGLYARRVRGELRLRFLDSSSEHRGGRWIALATMRRLEPRLDAEIAEALSMYDEAAGYRPDDAADTEAAWTRFRAIFKFVKPLVTYRPVYEDFLYHLLAELYEDNVQFVEIRSGFSSLYELDGSRHHRLAVVDIYNRVVDRFVAEHPGFLGVKWIFSGQRDVDRATLASYVEAYQLLSQARPNQVVGFDLVGQEDRGRPLRDFVPELLRLGRGTRFFFHAGETNWSGLEADENLLDAVLLDAKRIGHGYALLKHPRLMELVEQRRIAIEVSPISNQVLGLVKDLRNHPASYLFGRDLPIVVSSDDPGFWGARALSFDFYEAFLGIMSSRADLRALKQLAVNSIEHSSLSDAEKLEVTIVWQARWRRFVAELAASADD